MLIEYKIVDLLNAKDSLLKLATCHLPALTAFRLSKLISAINSELFKFDEIKNKLFNQYGTLDSETNQLTINEEFRSTFVKEINDILNEAVSIDIIPVKINLEELKDIEFTAMEMTAISKFIEF